MLSAGIVGLPNVGKSTLFNAVTRTHNAPAENYPFCTIDPNVGMVTVPDARLDVLAKLSHSQKIVPTAIEFVDIAAALGVVPGDMLAQIESTGHFAKRTAHRSRKA